MPQVNGVTSSCLERCIERFMKPDYRRKIQTSDFKSGDELEGQHQKFGSSNLAESLELTVIVFLAEEFTTPAQLEFIVREKCVNHFMRH